MSEVAIGLVLRRHMRGLGQLHRLRLSFSGSLGPCGRGLNHRLELTGLSNSATESSSAGARGF